MKSLLLVSLGTIILIVFLILTAPYPSIGDIMVLLVILIFFAISLADLKQER